jgi:hypothetical protein
VQDASTVTESRPSITTLGLIGCVE